MAGLLPGGVATPVLTRCESVAQAVMDVLLAFRDQIDGDSGLRSIQMTVHMTRDPARPSQVHDVLISLQSSRMMDPSVNGHAEIRA